MVINIYRNPFLVALWTPAYLMVGAVAINNDPLMGAMFIMCTLGLLAAYVTEFPIFATLYQNEILHKVAVSSLMGIVSALILYAFSLMFTKADEDAGAAMIAPAAKFFVSWMAMSVPGYLLSVVLISKVNKRDLDEEHRVRMEKKKNRKGGGPPIMKRDGF